MMLDLNLASSPEAEESPAAGKSPLPVEAAEEESGSSSSSVLNACEEDLITSEHKVGFRFGILKGSEEEGEHTSLAMTRQLLPLEIGGGSSSSPPSHLVDFSYVQQLPPQPPPPPQPQQPKKSRRGPRSRSSQYRGVTFYRRTGRWESHIWDCGKQIYLGGFDTAHAAARAYDRAAVKFRGVEADINFNLADYDEDLEQMRNLTKEEFVHILRRQSTGFARGSSKYRGVTLHKCGRWEARMGQLLGKKAYDKAAIKYNGREAVTNFESSTYEGEMLPEVDREVIGHDLDLNLRISQPNNSSPNKRDNPMGIRAHFGSFEDYDPKKARISNSSIMGAQSHGLATAPEPPQEWTALHPGLFPRTEERPAGMRPGVGSPAFSNWSWQIHGPTQLPQPLFSSAASSGFSTTTSAAALHSFPPPPSSHHLQFPPSHYYSRG